MCKLFDEWSDKIKEYCDTNGFDFDKAKKLTKSWGKNDIALLYNDPNSSSGLGLLDETPMPIVLMMFKQPDGSLKFEQTEHTRKYLM